MPAFKAKFHGVVQNSQVFGTSDEHMMSTLHFTLEVDGNNVGDYTADLKQAVGSDFRDPIIEVGPPNGYDGPFDHQGFSTVAQQYFNSMIGPYGRGARVEGSGGGIKMINCKFPREAEYPF